MSVEEPRCPKCGYTQADANYHGDHHLCSGTIPAVHTPTPWKVFGRSIDDLSKDDVMTEAKPHRRICDVFGGTKENPVGLANAEFIVRACNNHERLLAMLKELEECAAYWSEYDVPLGIVDRLRKTIADAERTVTP